MPGNPTLDIWMYGRRVAEARRGKKPAAIELRYTPEAIRKYGLNVPLLSCSLLTGDRWVDATAFVSGVLPEGVARDVMARRANVAASDVHGLVARFGRDAVGALSIVPTGENPTDGGAAEYYTDESLAAAIDELDENPLGLQDDSQLSLPGMQAKLLLIKTDTKTGWARPISGEPSTHILKRDHPSYPGIGAYEADCLRIAKHIGLTTITPTYVPGDPRGHLIVDRYDRHIDADGAVTRIHQEDLCQATGVNTFANYKAKAQAAGGPRFADAAELLATYARQPEAQLERLLRVLTFTAAIGNADAHGKNLSFLHHPDGIIELAPLYDTVPTLHWPKLKTTLGMYVGGCTDIRFATAKHVTTEAASWGVPASRVNEVLGGTIEAIRAAATELDIRASLRAVITDQTARLGG